VCSGWRRADQGQRERAGFADAVLECREQRWAEPDLERPRGAGRQGGVHLRESEAPSPLLAVFGLLSDQLGDDPAPRDAAGLTALGDERDRAEGRRRVLGVAASLGVVDLDPPARWST
jgi:hypothetical protein